LNFCVNVSSLNMKLLLDECTPARLRFDFPGHDAYTLEHAGLKGLKNGTLLRAANADFDVLITVDQNLPYQQNLSELSLAIVIVVARSNRYSDLKTLVPNVLAALMRIKAGDVVRVRA
jgi:predicted nuclease of predicted toxin-antitoxin system